jgi:hypothetical protein
MSLKEVMNTLQKKAKIEPVITKIGNKVFSFLFFVTSVLMFSTICKFLDILVAMFCNIIHLILGTLLIFCYE